MNTTASHLHIVIADDHALVRGGLSLLIRSANDHIRVTETNSFQETVKCLSEDPDIDLLLMDLMMPGMEGTTGVDHICKTFPGVPVAVISVKEDTDTIRKVLRAGASGYIPKTSPPKVTTSAIDLILSGGIYLPPHLLGHEDSRNDTSLSWSTESEFNANAGGEAKAMGITPRQKEVLDLLSVGKPNKEIAEILGLTPGTVKMHVSRIFKQMNVSNRTEAVAKYTQMKRKLEGT